MFERVAGIDIGKATLTVCVRTPGERGRRRRNETRTFKTTNGSLLVMRDWLLECGVTIAALESTSTYWKGCCKPRGAAVIEWDERVPPLGRRSGLMKLRQPDPGVAGEGGAQP